MSWFQGDPQRASSFVSRKTFPFITIKKTMFSWSEHEERWHYTTFKCVQMQARSTSLKAASHSVIVVYMFHVFQPRAPSQLSFFTGNSPWRGLPIDDISGTLLSFSFVCRGRSLIIMDNHHSPPLKTNVIWFISSDQLSLSWPSSSKWFYHTMS
jgi:hypothetical protein